MVDTDGRALKMQAHSADIQDRDEARPLLKASRRSFPFVELAFADSAYNAERVRQATLIAIEVVKKIADQVVFQVLPRPWVVDHHTMLPAWGLSGPHSFSVRAASGRILSWASSGRELNLSQVNPSRHEF